MILQCDIIVIVIVIVIVIGPRSGVTMVVGGDRGKQNRQDGTVIHAPKFGSDPYGKRSFPLGALSHRIRTTCICQTPRTITTDI